jgi:Peptidase family M28
MKREFIILCSLFAIFSTFLEGQEDDGFSKALNGINQSVLKAQLGFLASDWTEGRETGTKGEQLSADYIASLLQLYGVKPGGDFPQPRGYVNIQEGKERTYFQNFNLLKTSSGEEQVLKVKTSEGNSSRIETCIYNVDFTLWPGNKSVEIEAPVVFAGYGFKNDKLKHDDLGKLDLKGRFILKVSGSPAYAREQLSPSELSAAAMEAENAAKKMGAAGILEVNPNAEIAGFQPSARRSELSPAERNPLSGRPFADYKLVGKTSDDFFPIIQISVKTANEILSGTGINLDDFIKKAGEDRFYPIPAIRGKSIYLKTSVKNEIVRTRNVIGIIEGKNPDQIIVLGAHYDHLGSANGYIWNGADDNGSGTTGVLTIAKAVMETGIKPEKTLIFALWTAEEEGLLGSRYYVENLPYPKSNLRLNVNFDMISRYISDNDTKKVIMTFTDSCPEFKQITEANLKKYGIDLNVEYQPMKDPSGGSDHRSFSAIGIPIMRFKPGHREQYHTPADEVNTVNWDIMEKIVKISFANVWELANSTW